MKPNLKIKKIVRSIFIVLVLLYILFCGIFYIFQGKFIFYPHKLAADYQFLFDGDFAEINIQTADSVLINGLLFKSNESKGLVFFLHGNAGSLAGWGSMARLYTGLGYDCFILDYRGFGKSGGYIRDEEQLFSDVQLAYDEMTKLYVEHDIVVMGYSIGTGLASQLAYTNNPRMLVLHAPYYSLENTIDDICPVIPHFLIKFKIETYKYVSECRMPIVIFHGKKDRLLGYKNSLGLWTLMDKDRDRLILLEDKHHDDIMNNAEYDSAISEILD